MLKLVVVCLLVSWAAADNGWKPGTEYQYRLRGRTLTALHQVSKQYSGVVLRAIVTIQPTSQDALNVKVSQAEYSPVHTPMPQEWTAKLPEGQMNYKSLPISSKPFELRLKGSVIESMYVSQDTPTWEVNILKSIAGLFQVDAQKVNVMRSQKWRRMDTENRYNTMEDRVIGQCETLYEISRLHERLVTMKPELVPMPSLKGSDGEVLDIMKTTNFTNCKKRVGYHFGLTDITEWEKPNANKLGKFMSRSSMSRVIVTGTRSQFTIQSSVSTDVVMLSPHMYNKQKGMVGSRLNITLVSVRSSNEPPQQVSQPRKIGDLVYEYNPVFTGNDQGSDEENYRQGDTYAPKFGDERNTSKRQDARSRLRRSLNQDSSSSSSSSSTEKYQPKPELSRPPMIPFLPYFVGYLGRSIKYSRQVDPVQAIVKKSKEIASDLSYPSMIPQRDTLGKYTIVSRLVRTLSTKQLEAVTTQLYVPKAQSGKLNEQRLAWKAFRDSVATAGTGPALQIISQWIKSGQVEKEEAAKLLAVLPNTVRTPTSEYIDLFFELATDSEVVRQEYLNSTAILCFTELVRKAAVNKKTAHNWFPVHSFSRLAPLNYRKITSDFIPYLERQLKNALLNSESHKIQVYIRALGNLGHPQILPVFEPLLEGNGRISTFQRVLLITSLDKLVQTQPAVVQQMLYNIYENTGEKDQVRVAAVYQLMKTYPSESMLSKMATFTNQDTSTQVNAAVKSSIENAAKITDFNDINEEQFAKNTKKVAHLLSPEKYGLNLSRNFIRSFMIKELELSHTKQISYIGRSDLWLPNSFLYNVRKNLGGYKRQYLALGGMVSGVDDLVDELFSQFNTNRSRDSTKFTPRVSSRLLNDDGVGLEANIFLQLAGGERFFAYNNQGDLQRNIRMAAQALRSDQSFNYMKLYNQYQVTIAFPTITGVPFLYSLKTPTLMTLRGQVKVRTSNPDLASDSSDNSIPIKIDTSSELHVVYTSKTVGKISFTTPWDHQRYIAGLNTHTQVNLPLKLQLGVNTRNQKLQLYVSPLYPERDVNVLHYSSFPYTSQHDILNLVPASQDGNTKQIIEREPKTMNIAFGRESYGLSCLLKCTTEYDISEMNQLFEKSSQRDLMSIIYFPWLEQSIKGINASLVFEGSKSETRAVTFMLDYDNADTLFSGNTTYQSGGASRYYGNVNDKRPVDSNNEKGDANPTENSPMSEHRKKQFLRRVTSGMQDSYPRVVDMAIALTGPKNVFMVATAAYAQSHNDDKSKFLLYLHRSYLPNQRKQLEVCLSSTSEYLDVPWMSFTGALQDDPTSYTTANIKYGEKCVNGDEIRLTSNQVQTTEYKESLRDHPVVKQCQQRINKDDYRNPACQEAMRASKLPDLQTMTVNVKKVPASVQSALQLLSLFSYQYVDDNMLDLYKLRQSLNIDAKNMASVRSSSRGSAFINPDEITFNVRLNQHKPQELSQHAFLRQNYQRITDEPPRNYTVAGKQQYSRNSDPGSKSSSSSSADSSEESPRPATCNAQQLRVVKSDNLTCFSQRPVHTCGDNCKPNKWIDKKVGMVCLDTGDTSKHWIEMIKKGHTPNLSNRPPTKYLTIKVPDKCSPQQ